MIKMDDGEVALFPETTKSMIDIPDRCPYQSLVG